jgi:hypothetical protein
VTFAYDAEGNLLTRTAAKGALSSNPNYATGYAHDAENRLERVTDPARLSEPATSPSTRLRIVARSWSFIVWS